MRLILHEGDSLIIKLPSGRLLEVEVTQDTTSIHDRFSDQVFFGEDFDHLSNVWVQRHPTIRLKDDENEKDSNY
jgi:hypothetical protein